MDEMLTLPPELKTALTGFYSAPEPDAAFAARLELELRCKHIQLLQPALKHRFPLWAKRSSFMQTLRTRPALMILLVLLALGLLTGVAYAVGRSLGYIPGVGLVDQENGVRVLSAPVSVGKNEITVTVEQVVADAARTFITYRVEGISPVTNGFPICTWPPALQLPDGRRLDFLSGGGGGMESSSGIPMTFETSYTFPPIPAGEKTVTFLSPCGQPALTLQLVPAPVGFATPAAEIGATFIAFGPNFANNAMTGSPTPASATEGSPYEPYVPSFLATPTSLPNRSGLYLDKVVELATSYILIGNFTDIGNLPGIFVGSSYDLNFQTQFTDSDGNPLHFQLRPDLLMGRQGHGVGWAYEISKPVTGPVTLRLISVPINISERASFQFDTGDNPQIGQKWQINQPVTLLGISCIVNEVLRTKAGYTFTISNPTKYSRGILSSLRIANEDENKGRANSWLEYPTYTKATVSYEFGIIPSGLLTVELIADRTNDLPGPWTLIWSPPSIK
jgi:hypothetical protein